MRSFTSHPKPLSDHHRQVAKNAEGHPQTGTTLALTGKKALHIGIGARMASAKSPDVQNATLADAMLTHDVTARCP
jgi:hypothetical protein